MLTARTRHPRVKAKRKIQSLVYGPGAVPRRARVSSIIFTTPATSGNKAGALSSSTGARATATGVKQFAATGRAGMRATMAGTAAVAAYPFATSVSANGRYLLDQFSNPYFISGDSPQLLPERLTSTQMNTFFSNQQVRGFNSAQIHLIANERITANVGSVNSNGDAPFANMATFAGPVAAYWSLVDTMFDLAAQYGFTVWASPAENISYGPTLAAMSATNAFNYGVFLGNRYKNRPNLIWSFGNDWQPSDSGPDASNKQILSGIRSTGDTHLVTTWMYWPDSSWATFGWDALHQLILTYNYSLPYPSVEGDYTHVGATAPQPVFFGEGNYEGEHNIPGLGRPSTTDETIRRTAWWSLTWGACGHFFGQGDVWDFDPPGNWLSQVNSTVAHQMGYVSNLMPSLPNWQNLVPDLTHVLISSGQGTYDGSNTKDPLDNDFATVAVTPDYKLAVFYVPTVRPWTLTVSRVGIITNAYWYDPTLGTQTTATAPWTIPATAHADGTHDWVLVLQGTGSGSQAGARSLTAGTKALNNSILARTGVRVLLVSAKIANSAIATEAGARATATGVKAISAALTSKAGARATVAGTQVIVKLGSLATSNGVRATAVGLKNAVATITTEAGSRSTAISSKRGISNIVTSAGARFTVAPISNKFGALVSKTGAHLAQAGAKAANTGTITTSNGSRPTPIGLPTKASSLTSKAGAESTAAGTPITIRSIFARSGCTAICAGVKTSTVPFIGSSGATSSASATTRGHTGVASSRAGSGCTSTGTKRSTVPFQDSIGTRVTIHGTSGTPPPSGPFGVAKYFASETLVGSYEADDALATTYMADDTNAFD